MTVFAERNTDRRAEWIPHGHRVLRAEGHAQLLRQRRTRTLPRPDERTLVDVPTQRPRRCSARASSARARSQHAAAATRRCDVTVHAVAAARRHRRKFLACRGVPRRRRRASTGRRRPRRGDDQREGRRPRRPSPWTRSCSCATSTAAPVPVLWSRARPSEAVYAKAGAGTPRLAPGRYVRPAQRRDADRASSTRSSWWC